MPTVLVVNGFRFIIWHNDHEPAHTHVFKGDGEAKVSIERIHQRSKLLLVIGFTKKEIRQVLSIAYQHQKILWLAWERIHESGED